MKTVGTILATAFALLPWCVAPLFAQQTTPAGEKKIVITKRTVDADGTETTETLIKNGKAAENFDLDQYLKENRADNVQLDVRVLDGQDEEKTVVIRRSKNKNQSLASNSDDEDDTSFAWTSNDDDSAFLGVEESSDEDADQPGLSVDVVRGTAAYKAGLRSNDVILKLNGAAVNEWDELTKIIGAAKPGDKLQIIYSRDGKTLSTDALLTKHSDLKCDPEACKHGFLGVTTNDADEDAAGVKINIVDNSAAARAGLQNGDVLLKLNDTEISNWEDITDFMSDTKPGEKVSLTYQRNRQTNKAEAVLGEQKNNSWNLNWQPRDFNFQIREKEACLGVYSSSYAVGNQLGTSVTDFTEESAAHDAQMEKGDVITAVNGVPVKGHSELWDQIAKFHPGDKVSVDFLRDNQPRQIEATLKACKDNSNRVMIFNNENGAKNREFFLGNWDKNDQDRLNEHRVITIRRGAADDAPKVEAAPNPVQDRTLKLDGFRAYPNPSQGQVTVEFHSEPLSTVVSLLDISGRQLFREELNAFNGDYLQQFDLSEYAKGTIVIRVQQGDKVYTEQIIVN